MLLAWGVSETEAVMAGERPTPKSVLGLVGSYALAFALLVLGSVVGGAVAISIAAFAYGAVTSGEGVQDMVNVLALQGGLGMLGLAEGEYSTSAASAIYTMAFYLSFIGIWIVFLIYLRASKRVRPILGAVTETLRRGLAWGCSWDLCSTARACWSRCLRAAFPSRLLA